MILDIVLFTLVRRVGDGYGRSTKRPSARRIMVFSPFQCSTALERRLPAIWTAFACGGEPVFRDSLFGQ